MFMKGSKIIQKFLLGMVLLLAAAFFAGCDDGDDGARGPAGPPGPPGPPGSAVVDISTMTEEEQAELGTVTIPNDSISISTEDPTAVTFALEDELSRPVQGLAEVMGNDRETGRVVRFTLAKLIPPSESDSGRWYSYIRDEDGTPTYESQYGGGELVANDDGTYTYTFATDVTGDPQYDPGATHRLAGQLGGGPVNFGASNFVYDFVPDGSAVTENRKIAMTASCNECHDPLVFHGRRFDVGYCVTCHNPDLAEGEGSMAFMTHKLHAGGNFDVLEDGIDYAEVTYPQDLQNCRKCHNTEDMQTPQADLWRTVQNNRQCFNSCHGVPESVLEIGTFHQNVSGDCDVCHNGDIAPNLNVAEIHTTPNSTVNNPELLEGQREIEYEIDSAEVVGGDLVIDFRILSDGTALNLENLPPDLSDTPEFLFAYSEPQGGFGKPADFSNLDSGEGPGQPREQSLEGLIDGTNGSVICTGGTCTATMPDPFPAGSNRRTVGLQAYYQQDLNGDGDADVSLHTRSVVTTVNGDSGRRRIASNNGCASCHEILEAHGGNRVFTKDGGVGICTMCHTPNLTSSGRTLTSPLDDLGGNPLNYPEATNNMKDMIHGIHASDFRSTDYEFVRGGRFSGYFNWSEVTFPGDISNCKKCHVQDTYLPEEVPVNALVTTNRITQAEDGRAATTEAVETAREEMPNPTDWVITPVSAACYSCHDSAAAVSHMKLNGGAINEDRAEVGNTESCAICHNTGNIADVQDAHGLDD